MRLVEKCVHYLPPRTHAEYKIANICSRVATSATFKQAKGDLVKKGWDPADTKGDKLYWLNGTKYEKLDVQSWSSITSGRAKL